MEKHYPQSLRVIMIFFALITSTTGFAQYKGDSNGLPEMHFEKESSAPFIDLGLLYGYTNSSRTGVVEGPYSVFADRNTKSMQQWGGELKFLFGNAENAMPFIFMDATDVIGPTNALILSSDINPYNSNNSKVTLKTQWLARAGIGMQSQPFSLFGTHFTLAAGVGAAAIPQQLTAVIADGTPLGNTAYLSINKNMTSIQPTFLGNLTWDMCRACFNHLPVFLSAEILLDHSPSLSASGTSVLGNAYTVKIDSAWQTHQYLILGVRF